MIAIESSHSIIKDCPLNLVGAASIIAGKGQCSSLDPSSGAVVFHLAELRIGKDQSAGAVVSNRAPDTGISVGVAEPKITDLHPLVSCIAATGVKQGAGLIAVVGGGAVGIDAQDELASRSRVTCLTGITN